MRKLFLMLSIITITVSAVAPRVSAKDINTVKIQVGNGNQAIVQQINLANCDININELLSKLQSNGKVFDINNPSDLAFLEDCNIDISKLTNGKVTVNTNDNTSTDNKQKNEGTTKVEEAKKPVVNTNTDKKSNTNTNTTTTKPADKVTKPTETSKNAATNTNTDKKNNTNTNTTTTKPADKVTKPAESTTKPAETTTNNQNLSYIEQVVKLVNEERAKAGLNPVTVDTNLGKAANKRAQEIVTSFSHTRPNGSSFGTVLKEYNVSYNGAGENIAYGQKSPQEVMNGWMNSAGHRANILNAKFTKIGVGYYQSASGVNYWSQLFTY